MISIPEEAVRRAWDELNDLHPSQSMKYIDELQERQPLLLGYLTHTGDGYFSQEEKELFMFLGLAIIRAFENAGVELPPVDENGILAAEKRNASMVQYLAEEPENDVLGTVFNIWQGYRQRGLLRFIIEAMVEDEEEEEVMIQDENRAFMFISLKTLIDCLDAAGEPGQGQSAPGSQRSP